MNELLETFEREIEIEFEGENYSVRDNGSILRKNQYRKKARPNDNIWTFGAQNFSSRYLFISGVRVHRIVCAAFHGQPSQPNLVVDHIDTNRANNRPENLRWVTRLENILLNPVTCRRIELAYGSIDAFFDNPTAIRDKSTPSNLSWMRTVSLEEAQNARLRLLEWADTNSLPTGGAISEWVFRKKTYQPSREPKIDAGARADAIKKQIEEWDKAGELEGKNYHSYRPEYEPEFFESTTPTALQVAWKVPTEFPLCPEIVNTQVLETYSRALKFGEVFSRNHYAVSKVVEATQHLDSVVVLTNIADGIKPWGVVHLSADEEFVYHKSVGTYFELNGAFKEFCEFTGQMYEGGIGIDEYA